MLSAETHGNEPMADAIRHMLGVVNVLADEVAEMTGRTVPDEIRRAALIVERGE